MPNIHMPLPETEQSISRPVALDVVRQVQKITRMKDGPIYFSEDGKYYNSSGTIDSEQNRYLDTGTKRKNEIEVDEQMDPEELSPTFFNAMECASIFEDRKTGLVVTPIYAKQNVTISFSYTCSSKTEAGRWLQDMRMKLARLRDINIHTVNYHFNLNQTAHDIIAKVHELREKRSPYGETLEQYIRKHVSPRMTLVGDLAGKSAVIAFAQSQTEIYGQFDFDGLPTKPEKDNDNGMWVISFSYRFNYDKPIGCHIKYPTIVHNNLMPYEWCEIMNDETRSIAAQVTDGTRTQNAMRFFRADRAMDRIKSEDGMIFIPPHDDFIPEVPLRFTAGLIQGLTVVGDDNNRDIVDLKDLGDIVLDYDVLNYFMQVEYPYLLKPYQSLFNISIYQNSSLQEYDRFTITPDLMVKAIYDLNTRNQYRFRLSVVTDLDFVRPEAMQRIRRYPKVMLKVVRAINKAFRENPEMSKLGDTKLLNPCMFDYVYRHLLGKEGGVNFGSISFANSQYLRSCAIDENLVRRLKNESKFQARTMILGILAFRKDDPSLKTKDLPNMQQTA